MTYFIGFVLGFIVGWACRMAYEVHRDRKAAWDAYIPPKDYPSSEQR